MTKLYFAGAENNTELLKSCNVKNILISYYNKPKLSEKYKGFNVFLDSGAFSAHTQNKKINIKDYIMYIKKNHKKLEQYASLDVIGDAEKSYRNFKIMKKVGLNPIPCFHRKEDFKWLKKYIKEDVEYLALGGMVSDRKKKLSKWLAKCFHIIPKNVKIHGFGITTPKILKRFPFHSVDSTSWNVYGRFGMVNIFQRNTIVYLNKKNAKKIFGDKIGKTNTKKITKWNLMQWKAFSDYLEEENEN